MPDAAKINDNVRFI